MPSQCSQRSPTRAGHHMATEVRRELQGAAGFKKPIWDEYISRWAARPPLLPKKGQIEAPRILAQAARKKWSYITHTHQSCNVNEKGIWDNEYNSKLQRNLIPEPSHPQFTKSLNESKGEKMWFMICAPSSYDRWSFVDSNFILIHHVLYRTLSEFNSFNNNYGMPFSCTKALALAFQSSFAPKYPGRQQNPFCIICIR